MFSQDLVQDIVDRQREVGLLKHWAIQVLGSILKNHASPGLLYVRLENKSFYTLKWKNNNKVETVKVRIFFNKKSFSVYF